MRDSMPDERMDKTGPENPDSAETSEAKEKRLRRIGIYCLLFALWLLISIGLFHKMWVSRHEIAKEEGELKPWRLVNTEE